MLHANYFGIRLECPVNSQDHVCFQSFQYGRMSSLLYIHPAKFQLTPQASRKSTVPGPGQHGQPRGPRERQRRGDGRRRNRL